MCKELHEAVSRTIEEYPGSVKELAPKLGKTIWTLYTWMRSPDDGGSSIPGNMILPLCNTTGNYSIIKFLNNKSGHAHIKIPKNRHYSIKELTAETCKIIDGFSTFLKVTSKAFSDGKRTPEENEAICDTGMNAVEQVMTFLNEVKNG